MKKHNRLLCALTVLGMVVTLCACGRMSFPLNQWQSGIAQPFIQTTEDAPSRTTEAPSEITTEWMTEWTTAAETTTEADGRDSKTDEAEKPTPADKEKWVCVLTEEFHVDGTPVGSYRRFDYNEHGDLIREEQCISPAANPIVSEYIYEYDERGNPIYWCNISAMVDSKNYEYVYDGDRIVQNTETHWSSSGKTVFRDTYNSAGRKVLHVEESYNAAGDLAKTIEITYERDDKGRVLSESRYHLQGDVRYTARFSYDEHGNITQRRLDHHGSYFFDDMDYENEYDAQGHLVRVLQTQYWKGESYLMESRYEYDANGNRTKALVKDYTLGAGWQVSEYDSYGHKIMEYGTDDEFEKESYYTKYTYLPLSEYLAGR